MLTLPSYARKAMSGFESKAVFKWLGLKRNFDLGPYRPSSEGWRNWRKALWWKDGVNINKKPWRNMKLFGLFQPIFWPLNPVWCSIKRFLGYSSAFCTYFQLKCPELPWVSDFSVDVVQGGRKVLCTGLEQSGEGFNFHEVCTKNPRIHNMHQPGTLAAKSFR